MPGGDSPSGCSLGKPRVKPAEYTQDDDDSVQRLTATTAYLLASDGPSTFGYVAKKINSYGQYVIDNTGQVDKRLMVVLDLSAAAEGPSNIRTINGLVTFPFLGAINGVFNTSPDAGPGSYNYMYIAATRETSPNAPPALGLNAFSQATNMPLEIESAIVSILSFRPYTVTKIYNT
ncbi:hypothetical protein H0H81_006951 [Sphagnurus paluster]|uniref:Uncharacterized protein n=1 Tax=Sphagnurus paluster TaxID=117069 RepID=A0A9P7K3I0_9AGAR|nr:hypothetical protein H0H81_006951 [Sphagnurus paluster]